MRVTLSLLSLLGLLMIPAPASAQPSGTGIPGSQNVGMVERVDNRRHDGRRPSHRHYGGYGGYHRPYYPGPSYSYAYPYPYPYPYPYYAPYYGPSAGVSLSFGF